MPIVVSESNSEETLQAYAHPLSIQAKAISGLEERVLNGSVMSDGNNVFTYLTEFAANTVADAVNKACMCFNSLYPENAQTSTDLYKHLSDFDYIGLYATPAELTVELIFDRNFLIDNCVQIPNSSYYKIIIPEYSKFTVGEYTFGLMYPIEIRIRKAFYSDDANNITNKVDYANCAMAVMWDTSNPNPLKTLETHILEHRDFVQEGQTLTAIEVPIYQFEVENHVENAIASTGFAKRYDYMNKFYAARVYHFKNGKWNEMAQTLSDINYDVDKPTAMIKVLMDIGKVEVVIPQIYFNTTNEDAKIGNRVLVKIYNTQGELNLDISAYSAAQFGASFLMTDTILVEDDTYSNMLKRIPTIYMLPASKRISSGTDGITMSKLKERVKHSASYTVKITPDDLDAYFATSGFTFTKELDNITDRVYCAHKVITDSTGITVAAGDGKTVFLPETLNIVENEETGMLYVPGYSSISVLDMNSVTILPTAVYKYNEDDDNFTMLSDEEITAITNKTQEEKVAAFNNNLYTFSPFHIRMSLSDELPIAGSYDVYNPSMKSIIFDWENPNTTAEIAIYTASIKPLETENTGYRLNVALFKTDNLSSVEPKVTDGLDIYNIQVMLCTTNSSGVFLYMLGTYNGKDDSKHDVFTFDIKSAFRITESGMIDVTNMYDNTGDNSNNFLDLSAHEYKLMFFVKEEFITDSKYPMDGVPLDNIPGELDGYVHLCTQSFTLTLGGSLPLIKNNVTLSVSDEEYQKYPTTQFATYNSNIYYRWTIADYKKGVEDPVTEEPVSAAKIGSLKLDKEEVNEYYLTPDTTFKKDKDYYTKTTTGYTKATVVVGQAVTANTYYNLRKYKYTPCIQYNQGDVIINSPYGLMNIGPVLTMSIDGVTNTLTLDNAVCDYTVTSDLSNNWKSIDGNVFVVGSKYTAFTGMYTSKPHVGAITNKVWSQSHYSEVELYDTTTLDIQPTSTTEPTPTCNVTLYKYLDDNGHVVYSLTIPEATEDYETIVFNIASSDDKTRNFKSSNSDIVKADPYVSSTKNITVNTMARGNHRKWYLIAPGDTTLTYDFENDTGFIIEWTASEATSIGLSQSWCLNYNYRTKDDDGLIVKGVVIIDKNVKSSTSKYLNGNDRTKLDTDSYIAQYQEIYHKIHYVSGLNAGWYIGETVSNSDTLTAVQDYYYGPAMLNPDGTLPQPWEVEWRNLVSADKSELLVTCTNNTDKRYCAKIEDALNFIIEYLKTKNQKYQDASKLSRYVDDGKLSTDTVSSAKKTYYTRSESDNPFKPYAYTQETLEEGTVLVAQTSDTVFLANKTYWTYDEDEEEYVVAEVEVGTTVPIDPKYYDQIVHYEKCDSFLVDPLDGIVFTCISTCTDGRTQEYCNSKINYYPGTIDARYIDRKTAVGTDDALGAVYYRSPDFLDFDYKAQGLTYDQLVDIIENWNKYKIYSEAIRYKCVADATGVKQSIIKLIVSDTQDCYFTPWIKMINVSSYDALCTYYNTRKIVNCTVADLATIQSDIKSKNYEIFENLTALKAATPVDTYEVASGKFLYGVTYYTRSGSEGSYVYTKASVTVGDEIPSNMYYIKVYKTVFVSDITDLDAEDSTGQPSTAAKALRTWLGLEEDEGVSVWSADSLLGTATKPVCGFVKWMNGLERTTDSDTVAVTVLPIRCGYDLDSTSKAILAYGTYSGYMYVFTEYPDSESSTGTCKYINYTSKIDRTYSTDGSDITRNEFNVNFETSIWTEIDKWPWEIETPWIDITTATKADMTMEYNKDVSCAKSLYLNTDVMVDDEGNPIVAANGGRSVVYKTNMIHCDYKLALSDDTDYDTYITDIRELMRAYFNELNTISPSLLARTKMYYTPIKTFGTSQFKGNGGTEITLPLEFTIHLGLHVQSFVNGSDLNKTTIKNNILAIIDKRLKEGYLNLALLASDIMDELSDNIICVDVFGINGDNSLQTMIPVNSDCFPQLKQALELNDDGTISTIRRLDITWYVVE